MVHALNRLGTTKTMEDYLHYITNVVAASPEGFLQPLFSLTADKALPESTCPSLSGYRGMGPVRVGNDAYRQIQNDSYGAVVLATAPGLLRQAARAARQPSGCSSGWSRWASRRSRCGTPRMPACGKLRTRERVHTFSRRDVLGGLRPAGQDRPPAGPGRARPVLAPARRRNPQRDPGAGVFDPEQNSFVESFGGRDLDASLLLLHELGLVAADDPRFLGTVAAAEKHLKYGDFLRRYHAPDDFGEPEVAFTICSFWYV